MPGTWSREIHTQLRRASAADGANILAIYNQSIRRGEIARHCHQLTMAEFASALLPDEDWYPTYVTAVEGVTRGWAGFRPWHERAAYAFTLELLVYVAPTHRGRGLGKALVNKRSRQRHGRVTTPSLRSVWRTIPSPTTCCGPQVSASRAGPRRYFRDATRSTT
jgi:GNAT superfamily N-acetyltransferase